MNKTFKSLILVLTLCGMQEGWGMDVIVTSDAGDVTVLVEGPSVTHRDLPVVEARKMNFLMTRHDCKRFCRCVNEDEVTKEDITRELGNRRDIDILFMPCCKLIRDLDGVLFPKKLVDLYLDSSEIERLGGATFPRTLRTLGLGKSTKLISLDGVKFPDKLKKLYLDRCSGLVDLSLVKIPRNIRFISLKDCEKLEQLPNLGTCANLCGLDISGATKLIEGVCPELIKRASYSYCCCNSFVVDLLADLKRLGKYSGEVPAKHCSFLCFVKKHCCCGGCCCCTE
jgi:hypothetical protein